MELSDDDRMAMLVAFGGTALRDPIPPGVEAAYVAGLRAGMERAAKVCDGKASEWKEGGVYPPAAISCARAIRAAAK